jgi:hypothetical protein
MLLFLEDPRSHVPHHSISEMEDGITLVLWERGVLFTCSFFQASIIVSVNKHSPDS